MSSFEDYNRAILRALGDPAAYADAFLAGAGPKTLCMPNLQENYDNLQDFIPFLNVRGEYFWSAWGPSRRKTCTTM